MSILNSCLSVITRAIFRFGAKSENDSSTAQVTVRKGVLVEVRKIEYPQFIGSAIHGVRLPFKPPHLFKIDCNDDLGTETISVLANLTAKNEDAIKGMAVRVTSTGSATEFGSMEHLVTLD